MNKNFIYSKKDNKDTLIKYFLCLIPLVLYGIYKNGILLYQKNLISFLEIFKPLYLIIISLILKGLVDYIFKRKIELDYGYLNVAIISLFVMPSINIFFYVIVLFIGLIIIHLIKKKIPMNEIALLKVIIIIGIAIFGKYTYLNAAEANNIYSYNLFDIICGRDTGGISSTNIFLGVIICAYLSFFLNYKKNIPIYSYISYVICTFIIMLISKDFNVNLLFSSSVILGLIFVATEPNSSPYTYWGQVIYSIFIGVMTAILSDWLKYDSVFIAVLVAGLGKNIFDNIGRKIKRKQF